MQCRQISPPRLLTYLFTYLLCKVLLSYLVCVMAREIDDLLTRETPSVLYSSYTLAAKQPRTKSGGLLSPVSNAGEGLQRADQGHRRTTFVYRNDLGTNWINY